MLKVGQTGQQLNQDPDLSSFSKKKLEGLFRIAKRGWVVFCIFFAQKILGEQPIYDHNDDHDIYDDIYDDKADEIDLLLTLKGKGGVDLLAGR